MLDVLHYLSEKKTIGALGEIHPKILKIWNIDFPVFYAEINLSQLKRVEMKHARFKSLPRFPEVRRDLALLVSLATEYADIEKLAFTLEPKLVKEVTLFDVYEGKNLPEGKKSYAISLLLYREDATLTDKQIEAVMHKLIKGFEEKLNATLRN